MLEIFIFFFKWLFENTIFKRELTRWSDHFRAYKNAYIGPFTAVTGQFSLTGTSKFVEVKLRALKAMRMRLTREFHRFPRVGIGSQCIIRLSKCQKIYTSAFSNQKLYPPKMLKTPLNTSFL